MHVRKGDQVIVIAGNDKGAAPAGVVAVDVAKNRVVVEGVSVRVKHRRPTQQNPQGERVEAEAVHASNVMLVDPKTGKGTRKRRTPKRSSRRLDPWPPGLRKVPGRKSARHRRPDSVCRTRCKFPAS
ncbi:MAG: 50S ribosomal protein L24 [Planctomycetota bacterium]